MKVVSNRLIQVQEANEVLGIKELSLSVSVVKLSEETAQVIVIDPRSQAFTNLICVMNLPSSTEPTATVLVDDLSEAAKARQETAEDEQTDTSDLAKLLGQKICRKAGLKQLFFSFSVDFGTTSEFQKNFRMMMATEQKVTQLIKSLEI